MGDLGAGRAEVVKAVGRVLLDLDVSGVSVCDSVMVSALLVDVLRAGGCAVPMWLERDHVPLALVVRDWWQSEGVPLAVVELLNGA